MQNSENFVFWMYSIKVLKSLFVEWLQKSFLFKKYGTWERQIAKRKNG